jgi:hypothetical protein
MENARAAVLDFRLLCQFFRKTSLIFVERDLWKCPLELLGLSDSSSVGIPQAAYKVVRTRSPTRSCKRLFTTGINGLRDTHWKPLPFTEEAVHFQAD